MNIDLLINNLFLQVKAEEILKKLPNIHLQIIRNISAWNQQHILIANLDDVDDLMELQQNPQNVICCASHKDVERINQVKSFGCKHVYPKSVFFMKLCEILKTSTKTL